ncbi:MAG: DNA-binding response regulator [Actinomycetia bacterium]|nr:DNA-binding response regulator [Actinomycetes bacterium]
MAIRVIVADDQPVVRAGFAAIVAAEPDMTVTGEAADGAAAVRLATSEGADVVVMDIRMPGMDGLTATALLTARTGGPRVLVLTTFDLDEYVFEALRAGASGFLLKDAEPADLLRAIRIVAAGECMLAPTVTRRLIQAYARDATGDPATPSGGAVDVGAGGVGALDGAVLGVLTRREREVLTQIASGLSNQEIGEHLGVATGTVKTHVNAVLAKLGVRDRVQATILAYDTGLARPRRR